MVRGIAGSATVADDLATSVDSPGRAIGAPKGAEIDQPLTLRPREGMEFGIAASGAPADDLAAVIYVRGRAEDVAESAEIDQPARPRP